MERELAKIGRRFDKAVRRFDKKRLAHSMIHRSSPLGEGIPLTEKAKGLVQDGNRAKKEGYHAIAGRLFLGAASYIAEEDVFLAGKYAHIAKKEFEEYQKNPKHRGEYVTRDIYNSPANWLRGNSYYGVNNATIGDIKQAEEVARAFRHLGAINVVTHRKKVKGIESHVNAVVFIAIGIVGLFFLSPNLTGNVIGNLPTGNSSVIGAILFLVGLVGAFFTYKNKSS